MNPGERETFLAQLETAARVTKGIWEEKERCKQALEQPSVKQEQKTNPKERTGK